MRSSGARDRFLSPDNFYLAWRRLINSVHRETADNLDREAFRLSVDENLRSIAERVANGEYEPSRCAKIYIPKSNFTLRTRPVLTVSDAVVYQAIANIIAEQARADLSILSNQFVFAHLPTPPGYDYAILRWWDQDPRFKNRYCDILRHGNDWVVKADIASFYDSVDHELLRQLIEERWLQDDLILDLLCRCLRTWTGDGAGHTFGRGVPQGYDASDFLASLFLYPIDQEMIGKGYEYVRYVDDIRILASTKDKANRGLIDLDLALKNAALILQARKTSLLKIEDIEKECDNSWAELSYIARLPGEDREEELHRVFVSSLRRYRKGLDKQVESDLVFALNRMKEPHEDVRDEVLRLLGDMPWRSESLTRYLVRHFKGDPIAIKGLRDFVETHTVYGWALADALYVLARISDPDACRDICKEWVLDTRLPWYQRTIAVDLLGLSPANYAFLDFVMQDEPDEMVRRSMLANCYHLANDRSQKIRLLKQALTDPSERVKRVGLSLYLSEEPRTLKWTDLDIEVSSLDHLGLLVPDIAAETAERLRECFIVKTLRDWFEVSDAPRVDFVTFFGDQATYNAAVEHLKVAMRAYDTSPSRYVTRMDNFNQIVTWKIYDHFLPTVNYKKDEHANNIRRGQFKNLSSVIAGAFERCHAWRSQCAEAHAYAKSLGSLSEEVPVWERDKIATSLKAAYIELTELWLKHRVQGASTPSS